MKNNHVYHNLDGLRGLAALSVVFYHYITFFVPFLIGYGVSRQTHLGHFIGVTPLNLFAGGNFAVCIFFVLSGFVLSLSFFKHKTVDVLISSASRRYLRLMLPALGSVILSYFFLRAGLMYIHQAQPVVNTGSLGAFWNFTPHFFDAVYQGIYTIFVTDMHSSAAGYNPVLWTMHYELFGSFLVFMFLALFGKFKRRYVFYVLFGLVFIKTYYLAFISGMVMADVFVNYPAAKTFISKPWTVAGLIIGVFLSSWPTEQVVYLGPFAHIDLPGLNVTETYVLAHILGAVLVMYAAMRLKSLSLFLEKRPLQYLGRISFSLYLVHFIILGSLGAYIFSHTLQRYGDWTALAMTAVPSLALTFAIAALYTRWVDMSAIKLSKVAGNYLINGFGLPNREPRIQRARPAQPQVSIAD